MQGTSIFTNAGTSITMNAGHQRNHECRGVFVSPEGPERGDAEAGRVSFVDNEKAFDAVDWVDS